jgi:hypothetical protein
MNTTFADGPAAGKSVLLQRAPIALRVVIDQDGKMDALDLLEDAPQTNEEVYVYVREGGVTGAGFVDYRDSRGRRQGKRFESGIYKLFTPQPRQVDVRSNKYWKEWVMENEYAIMKFNRGEALDSQQKASEA